jgi:hypothetical protein
MCANNSRQSAIRKGETLLDILHFAVFDVIHFY